MASDRPSLKRNPLSDLTNTIPSHAAAARRKPSQVRATRRKKSEAPSGSLKSNTSTGSNNPQTANSALISALDESEKLEVEKRKDKGKAFAEYIPALLPEHPAPLTKIIFSAAVSDESEKQEVKKRKDKGKAVAEYVPVLQPDPPAPLTTINLSTAVSGESEIQEAKKRKDKGKAVAYDSIALQSELPTPSTKLLSSAILSGEREIREAIKRKDKAKAVVESTVALQSEPPTPFIKNLQEAIKRKEKERAVVKDIVALQSESPTPLTPSTKNLSSTTVSGTAFPDSIICRTVYTRKRLPETRNVRSLKITDPFSCPPPLKRLKDKGNQINDMEGDGASRMQRVSFTAHKPKQTHAKPKRKTSMDIMPKEEVEKLRAYYADIDAFELEVEKASDNDLD